MLEWAILIPRIRPVGMRTFQMLQTQEKVIVSGLSGKPTSSGRSIDLLQSIFRCHIGHVRKSPTFLRKIALGQSYSAFRIILRRKRIGNPSETFIYRQWVYASFPYTISFQKERFPPSPGEPFDFFTPQPSANQYHRVWRDCQIRSNKCSLARSWNRS